MSREYYDNQLRNEQTLADVLPGQDLVSRWADIDDAKESDTDQLLELGGANLVGEDITLPVIPKRADEVTCSTCSLIHHISRLASARGGQLICTDCA